MNSIKTGATLSAYIQITNKDNKKPMIIDDSISISGNITNYANKVLTPLKIVIQDQEKYPGFILLNVSADITSTWGPGEAFLNLKLVINKAVVKTDSYKFIIIKDNL